MKKSLNKKAIMSALAITVGTAASVSAIDNVLKDPLFSLKEINSQSVLIAHGGEGKCGEGKCGGKKEKKAKKAAKAKGAEAKGAEAKGAEAKGAEAKGTEAKSAEGAYGTDEKRIK